MKEISIISVIDTIERYEEDNFHGLTTIKNDQRSFSKMLTYIDTCYKADYILWVTRPSHVDLESIQSIKQNLKECNANIIIDMESKKDKIDVSDVLKCTENINMCLMRRESLDKIEEQNNVQENVDILFTEVLLKISGVNIIKRQPREQQNCNNKLNINNYIKKVIQLIKVYEEQGEYIYHDLRYIKDLRVIIEALKKITSDKKRLVEYLKLLHPFAKEIINVHAYRLDLMEELFINQVSNKEIENSIKTLRYLSGERPDATKDEVLDVENEFYRLKCEEILTSKSWAITKPLRMPKQLIKKIKDKFKG